MNFFEKRKEKKKKRKEYVEAVKTALVETYEVYPTTADMIIYKFGVEELLRKDPMHVPADPKKMADGLMMLLADIIDKIAEK